MTYDVLLIQKDQKFIARVRQWPEIVVEGETEEKALAHARADLEALLLTGRIVPLEVEVKPDQHPWSQFAGMFADDPDWENFQKAIDQNRTTPDKAWAE